MMKDKIEKLKLLQSKSTCDRGRAACILLDEDENILAEGYSHSGLNTPSCDEIGHLIHVETDENNVTKEHCVRTIHAEQSAICDYIRRHQTKSPVIAMVTMTPCPVCARMLVELGTIKEVICLKRYHNSEYSEKLFSLNNIYLQYIDNEVEKY